MFYLWVVMVIVVCVLMDLPFDEIFGKGGNHD